MASPLIPEGLVTAVNNWFAQDPRPIFAGAQANIFDFVNKSKEGAGALPGWLTNDDLDQDIDSESDISDPALIQPQKETNAVDSIDEGMILQTSFDDTFQSNTGGTS